MGLQLRLYDTKKALQRAINKGEIIESVIFMIEEMNNYLKLHRFLIRISRFR